MNIRETPFTALLFDGPFDGAQRPILSAREYEWHNEPPPVVHVAACPCCERVAIWEPGQHPHASMLPEPVTYTRMGQHPQVPSLVHYRLPEEPDATADRRTASTVAS